MYLQTRKNYEVPKTQNEATYPIQYVVKLVSENKEAKLKLTKEAMKLLEHIEIVKEARKLYSEGKVITWEEFTRNES